MTVIYISMCIVNAVLFLNSFFLIAQYNFDDTFVNIDFCGMGLLGHLAKEECTSMLVFSFFVVFVIILQLETHVQRNA